MTKLAKNMLILGNFSSQRCMMRKSDTLTLALCHFFYCKIKLWHLNNLRRNFLLLYEISATLCPFLANILAWGLISMKFFLYSFWKRIQNSTVFPFVTAVAAIANTIVNPITWNPGRIGSEKGQKCQHLQNLDMVWSVVIYTIYLVWWEQ